MNTLANTNRDIPRKDVWLHQSGLNGLELALASVHQHTADRLIGALFSVIGVVRSIVDQSSRLFAMARRWVRQYAHPVDWEFERYLAGATDRADLEHRMREWARRRRPIF